MLQNPDSIESQLETQSSDKTDRDESIITLARMYNDSKNINKLMSLGEKLIEENHLFGYYIITKLMVFKKTSRDDILTKIQGIFNVVVDLKKYSKEVNFILDFLNKSLYEGTLSKDMYYYFIDNDHFTKYKLPHHFSWVIPGKLAGMLIPKENDIKILSRMGIKNIITCLEEPLGFKRFDGIKVHFFEVTDRTPPSLSQIKNMINIINSGPTVVHCLGGVGRTNTVLACYIINSQHKNASDAIELLEKLRQKVLLSNSQREFIKEYSNTCFKNHDDYGEQHQKKISRNLPKLLLCVGYPASGKTTFSKHVTEYYDNIVRINQDDQTRSGCIDLFNKNVKNNKTIIVDGCNITKERRKEWLDLAFKPRTWCIWFDTSFEECKYRISRRKNHPTVKDGNHGIVILNSLQNKLEPPTLEEGFEKIIRITKDEEVNLLLQDIGIDKPLDFDKLIDDSEKIIKFPRTKHLINFGSASRDDLLCTTDEQKLFINEAKKMNIFIEEKVDGANLGISIGKDYKIRVQNRSHYVNSNYHAQFRLIDKWILQHTSELVSILEPETEILYGEWLYMKHSINYTRLPDYFLAFDIYNVKTCRFLSRNKVTERLKNTSIKQVPLISYTKIENTTDFENLMKLKSNFYDGLIEGVYLRICDDNYTTHRAKIVRNDFISGDQHWSKNAITVNTLLPTN